MNDPIPTAKEDIILFEDKILSRELKISISNNSNTIKITSISFNEYNTVFKTNFVFHETNKATLTDMTEVDLDNFYNKKLGAYNWLVVHTIFDKLCWRSLHNVLSPKELTKFKDVFDSSDLHFFAFNQKQIYLFKIFLGYGQNWPSLIILRLQTGNITGLKRIVSNKRKQSNYYLLEENI